MVNHSEKMKKLIYTSLVALTAFFAVSCETDNIEAKLDLSQAKNQVLGSFPDTELSADGGRLTASFDPAKYNATVPVGYTLLMDVAGNNFASAVKPAATISVDDATSMGTISLSQKDLNSALLNMGAVADESFRVDFKLMAYALNDKNNGIESTGLESNVVSASFVPYSADLLDVDVYDHIWIIGASATVGAWSHDKVYQYLYNYSKDGKTFVGMIDYGTDAASGWKLTGIAGWDDSCNWGSEAQAEEAEAASMTLISAGSSKDIKNYSKRFYKWSFDNSSLVLTKVFGFDNIGIVGSFNSWNAADENLKMNYNGAYHRFYIDYTFAEDCELKFTTDDSWDLNWGVDMAQGGDNIAVAAGSYRIYVDFNTMEYKFDANMYGKEEPTGTAGGSEEPDEPATYKGWGIIGVGGDWDNDIAMTENDGIWTGYAQISTSDSFKLRKDADWTENYGGALVSLGEAFAAVAGGDNITVPADGFYKIVLDTKATTITVSEGEVWSLIGAFNNWAGDVDMVKGEDGKWVSPATTLSGEFKIRYNHGWDVNRGGTMEAIGTAFAVEAGGANINIETEADYIVTYDPAAETILVENALPKNSWSLIGVVADSEWNKDFYMTETMPGLWVSDPVVINGEFKIRFDNGWDVNRGGTLASLDKAFAVENGGANIAVPTTGDTYVVTYYAAAERISVHSMSTGWSLIGTINGTSWNTDVPMLEVESGIFSATCYVDSEVKIRYGAAWDNNRGGDFAELGTEFEVTNGGNNIKLDAGYYTITYNSAKETVAVRKAWSLIGGVFSTGWGSDLFMVNDGAGNYVCNYASLDGEWKIREGAAWDNNRGGTMESLGTAFAVENGGANIASPGSSLYKVVYNPSAETITVTDALSE